MAFCIINQPIHNVRLMERLKTYTFIGKEYKLHLERSQVHLMVGLPFSQSEAELAFLFKSHFTKFHLKSFIAWFTYWIESMENNFQIKLCTTKSMVHVSIPTVEKVHCTNFYVPQFDSMMDSLTKYPIRHFVVWHSPNRTFNNIGHKWLCMCVGVHVWRQAKAAQVMLINGQV